MRTARLFLNVALLAVIAGMVVVHDKDIINVQRRIFHAEGGLHLMNGGLRYLSGRIDALDGGLAPAAGGLALDLEYARAATVVFRVVEPTEWGTQTVTGSGVFMSDNIVLTAKHVVENRIALSGVEVLSPDGRSYAVLEILEDVDDDLALVVVARKTGPRLEPGRWPSLGDKVISIGYPLGQDLELNIFWGRVSSENHQNTMFSYHGFCRPGCSGGPVIVHGRVAGICSEYLTGSCSLGYAAPLERLDPGLRARL